MSTDIIVRDYLKGDEDQLVPLLIKGFPFWSKLDDPAAYFKWKYLDTPRGSFLTVAAISEKIVGCDLCIQLNFKLGDVIAPGELSGDSTTDSDYRGKGIYTKITEFETQNHKLKFSYWGTSNPYVIAAQNKQGTTYRFPDKMNFLVIINDIDYHLKNRPFKNSVLVKYAFSSLKLINKLLTSFNSENIEKDYEITRIENFDDSHEEFWNKIKEDYDFIQEKNMSYLNWRYGDPRGGIYVIFEATQKDEILGYIILNITNLDNYVEGYLAELLTIKNRPDIAYSLIKTSVEYLNKEKVNVIYYMGVSKSPYLKYLRKNGFIDAWIKSHNIYVEKKDETLHNILFNASSSRIYMSYGDFL